LSSIISPRSNISNISHRLIPYRITSSSNQLLHKSFLSIQYFHLISKSHYKGQRCNRHIEKPILYTNSLPSAITLIYFPTSFSQAIKRKQNNKKVMHPGQPQFFDSNIHKKEIRSVFRYFFKTRVNKSQIASLVRFVVGFL